MTSEQALENEPTPMTGSNPTFQTLGLDTFRFPENPENGGSYSAMEFLELLRRMPKPKPSVTDSRIVNPIGEEAINKAEKKLSQFPELPVGILDCVLTRVEVVMVKEFGYWKYNEKTGNPEPSPFKNGSALLSVMVKTGNGGKPRSLRYRTENPEWLIGKMIDLEGQALRFYKTIEKNGRRKLDFKKEGEAFDFEKTANLPSP